MDVELVAVEGLQGLVHHQGTRLEKEISFFFTASIIRMLEALHFEALIIYICGMYMINSRISKMILYISPISLYSIIYYRLNIQTLIHT